MRTKQLPHRIIQYIIGLVCMAIGLVLLKITHWGVSPITALPDAVANITPLTLGNATILLHLLCVVLQIIVQKRVTLKSVLCMCVGVPFGYLVDFFLWVWVTLFPELVLWQKVLSLVVGIAIQGFGVALISGCDLMLPAPDELNNVIANAYHKQLSNVKMIADAVYVALALVINLISIALGLMTFSQISVWINSIASVLLTGRFVGLSRKLFPKIVMAPFFETHAEKSKASE